MKITLYKTTIKSKDKITIFRKCKVLSEKKKKKGNKPAFRVLNSFSL